MLSEDRCTDRMKHHQAEDEHSNTDIRDKSESEFVRWAELLFQAQASCSVTLASCAEMFPRLVLTLILCFKSHMCDFLFGRRMLPLLSLRVKLRFPAASVLKENRK